MAGNRGRDGNAMGCDKKPDGMVVGDSFVPFGRSDDGGKKKRIHLPMSDEGMEIFLRKWGDRWLYRKRATSAQMPGHFAGGRPRLGVPEKADTGDSNIQRDSTRKVVGGGRDTPALSGDKALHLFGKNRQPSPGGFHGFHRASGICLVCVLQGSQSHR